jgi:hypothetical protein
MWLLLGTARAAMPPGVDLDDVEKWEVNADRLLALPPGCWEWVGQVAWDWDVGRFGGSAGHAVIAGRTLDGAWGSILLRPQGELRRDGKEDPVQVYDAKEARFAPLVGRLTGGQVTVAGGAPEEEGAELEENAEAVNVLHEALDRISGSAYTSWAEWDEARGGVVLHRSIPLEGGGEQEIVASILFPDGGTLPTALDLAFPEAFRTGGLFGWTIRDATVHVQGVVRNGEVYPSAESFSFGFGTFGFRFSGAQTLTWKEITRCGIHPG